jgi:hypothetical protein
MTLFNPTCFSCTHHRLDLVRRHLLRHCWASGQGRPALMRVCPEYRRRGEQGRLGER